MWAIGRNCRRHLSEETRKFQDAQKTFFCVTSALLDNWKRCSRASKCKCAQAFRNKGGGDNIRVIITLILWILISITVCLPTRCRETYPAHSALEVPSCQRATICLRDVHNPCHCVCFEESGEKMAPTFPCIVALSSEASRDRVCSIVRPSCITVCDLAQKPHRANLCCVPCFSRGNSYLLANGT